jgi:hypothetical protein
MLKIAFIGDSFSAYRQDGQFENHWSWKLAQQFPQHKYYNYALGGRGVDHHQWCLLDAKKRGVDVVFINRTFTHRVAQQYSDDDCTFDIEFNEADNYFSMSLLHHIWFSGHQSNTLPIHVMGNNAFHPIAAEITASLKDKAMSEQNQQYNDQWFNNVDQLYNFKHIIKLELMPLVENSAQHQLHDAHDINRIMFEAGESEKFNKFSTAFKNQILLDAGLIYTLTDDHWSAKANTWVLKNYILTKETIDILNNS